MQNNKNFLRVFSIFVLGFFMLGVLALVWNTVSRDTSLRDSGADSAITCGGIDSNNNAVLDDADYSALKELVGKTCIDTTSETFCGPRDLNSDGKIDLNDLSLFGTRYAKANCGL